MEQVVVTRWVWLFGPQGLHQMNEAGGDAPEIEHTHAVYNYLYQMACMALDNPLYYIRAEENG